MKIKLPVVVERSLAEAKAGRSELVRQFVDSLQKGESPTVCKKGCHNCCYHPVYLSLLEGISLFQWLSKNSLWTRSLKEAFQSTSETTRSLAPEVWALSLIPCPLLKDGLCTAYEARPFACQVTFSIGDPSACHPHQLGEGMLPKRALFEELSLLEIPVLRRHYLTHFRVPLAAAVLYGERVVRGEIDFEDGYHA